MTNISKRPQNANLDDDINNILNIGSPLTSNANRANYINNNSNARTNGK